MEAKQKKKKPGPAPTGKGQLLGVRIQPPMLEMLDEWIKNQPKPTTRQEAIRQILFSILVKPNKN